MKHLSLLLIAIALIAFVGCKKEKPVPKKKPKAKVVKVEKDTVKVQPKPQLVIDEGVDLNDKYFIVVDCYTVEDFAKARAGYFKKKGLKPGILMINEDGWYRLAVKSFDNRTAAKEALKKMKSDVDFSKAWVMGK